MLRFGDFVLDRDARQLFRGGPASRGRERHRTGRGVDVLIDARGVSRRDACIRMAGRTATIEDLGSKNGTFVGDEPVSAPTPLADGAAGRLGRVALVFRNEKDTSSTLTENR